MKKHLFRPWDGKLQIGVLKSRPHRFRINASLAQGRSSGVHCVNPGRGEGLMRKGAKIWVSHRGTINRDLKWTWELGYKGRRLVGTNSTTANFLIGRSLSEGLIRGLKGAKSVFPERTTGARVRLDFEVIMPSGQKHFIEVKNCHLRYPDGLAYFPDSKTDRSVKHLQALRRMVRKGHKASLFITIQRSDVSGVRPSDFHDPKFARALILANRAGVNVRAFCFRPTLRGFIFIGEVPVDLYPYSLEKIRKWPQRNQKHSGWNHWNSKKDISY